MCEKLLRKWQEISRSLQQFYERNKCWMAPIIWLLYRVYIIIKCLFFITISILIFWGLIYVFKYYFPESLQTPEALASVKSTLQQIIYTNPNSDSNPFEELQSWFYFLAGVGSAALAFIGWQKAGEFKKQNEANFLLRVDERWGSREAIKARIIIHEIYRDVINGQKNMRLKPLSKRWETGEEKAAKNYLENLYMKKQSKFEGIKFERDNELELTKDDFIQAVVGIKIVQMSATKNMAHKFIHLLNFLDFMETIGYIQSKRHVTVGELEALCGESLLFNYKIFKPYIENKRARHQKQEYYKHFDNLYRELKDKSKIKAD